MTTRQTIKRFARPATAVPFLTVKQLISFISRPIGSIGTIYILKKLIYLIETDNQIIFMKYLYRYGWFLVLYFIFLRISRNWTRVTMQNSFSKIIYQRYLSLFLELDNNYVESKGTGTMISIIEKGTQERGNAINDTTRYGSSILVVGIFAIWSLRNIGIIYLLIFLITIGITIYIMIILQGVSATYRNKKTEEENRITRNIVKILMSKMEIFQNNRYTYEINNIGVMIDNCISYNKQRSNYVHWAYSLPEILISGIKFAIFFVVGAQIFNGISSISNLVVMIASCALLEQVINEFTTYYKELTKNFHKIELLRSYIEDGPKLMINSNSIDFKYFEGNIKLQKLKYGYNKNNKVFNDLSITINGSQKTALVGPSGGGKSTLIKLIAGYIRPDSGTVIIDGQDLQDVSLKSYYKHIGYLTQEPSVFDGTVWENLTYGLQGNTEEQDKLEDHINHIIKLARCEFVHEFKNGLQTEIGEKGVRLSGGQRQRLAIAKIMLKDPDIILLDEPTSALDSENEELVTQALNELFRGKTVIVIAHRLQTVKHADQILYIDDGQIIESGTHQELLDLGAKYATMVELQSGF